MKRTLFYIGLLLAPEAYAGGDGGSATSECVGCATEATQMMNNAELVASVAQQAQMLQQQLSQLQQAMTQTQIIQYNSRQLGGSNYFWSDASNLLRQLQSVVQQGNALSYASSNMDSRFRAMYPGYSPATNYSQSYRDWSSALLDSIRGSLNAANLQAQNFATEDGLMQQLQITAQNVDGQLMTVQLGNSIAIETVQQLRKLRALNLAQMQAQNLYMATEAQQKAASQASQDKLFNNIPDPRQGETYQYFKGGSK